MCQHISLTIRGGYTTSYELMDCSRDAEGTKRCILGEKSIAHLMASGQFTKISVQDQEDPKASQSDPLARTLTKDEIRLGFNAPTVTHLEKDFPAFIEKVLGAQALQERHHVPEKIGQLVR